jgi:serine phosphatase RsbU (regulator of sigma subunit)
MSDCEYELGEDDYVLMLSDGVLECFSDEKALLKAFTGMEPATPREVANYLMQCAIRRCGGHIRDDMTILVGKLNASGGCT